MTYPPDFIARVKAAYPDSEIMNYYAATGSQWLGRYLCDSKGSILKIEVLLPICNAGDWKEMARLINLEHEREQLWYDWQKTDIAKKNRYGKQ